MQAISSDLQTQWQDHFHMRDQTWKVLQYSILFFLGVVGLEIKQPNEAILIVANTALLVTSIFGFIVALHHRQRQKEKFEIILIYETKLGLYELIKPVLDNAHRTIAGRINTSTYIVVMQLALALMAILLLGSHYSSSLWI
ncbi:MAG: hypothetical protein GKS00_12335 [Alphaproteobacteria bacterium]|nr:hypothetical protein [Alphaproteobacteria bacterium]